MDEEDKRKYISKEAKLIEKALTFEDQRKFQQTNIQDFFFSSGANSTSATLNPANDISETQLLT